ncbi:MAG: glycosyltransferase family 4 protein [Thermoplasmata archaeon]|nr:glycosyltransferase family 4 protein [Thermoplasmata archaeon]
MGSPNAGRGRVAIVSHGFFPTVGGSERYHLFTARAVAESAEVEVFTSDRNLPPGSPAPPERVALGAVGVHYLPSRKLDAERFVRVGALWRALRRFRPDVLWANHPSPTADVGAIYALLTRRPWVATYHADVSTDRWRNRRYLAWEMWLLRRARWVLVTSDRYRDILVHRGIRSDRIVVAPPGPYIGDGVLPTATNAGTGGRTDAPFLFVGALDAAHGYKRLDLLLEAMAALGRANVTSSLEVIGDGDRRPEFEAQSASLGLTGRVHFLGRLDDAQVAERMAGARALVMPAPDSTEGFGSVAVEAVQYGCPVVVSANVSVGDLLGRAGAAAVFDPARADAMQTVLGRLATDPAWRASLSEGARTIAPSLRWEPRLAAMTAPVRELLTRRNANRSGR